MALLKRGKTWHTHFLLMAPVIGNHLRRETGEKPKRRKRSLYLGLLRATSALRFRASQS
jgi:hypothetical protein